jgi:hypothetical protein
MTLRSDRRAHSVSELPAFVHRGSKDENALVAYKHVGFYRLNFITMSAISSRALVVEQPQSIRVEGADISYKIK